MPSSVRQPGTYTSIFPLDLHASWEKNAVVVRHLYALRGRVKALERAALQPPPPAASNKNETTDTDAA